MGNAFSLRMQNQISPCNFGPMRCCWCPAAYPTSTLCRQLIYVAKRAMSCKLKFSHSLLVQESKRGLCLPVKFRMYNHRGTVCFIITCIILLLALSSSLLASSSPSSSPLVLLHLLCYKEQSNRGGGVNE